MTALTDVANKLIEEKYEEFWKDIIETDGEINTDQLKKELFDYLVLMEQAGQVYCEITNGKLSKTNYPAKTIITEYEDCLNQEVSDAVGKTLIWNPIETAPKNGEEILVCYTHRHRGDVIRLVYWNSFHEYWESKGKPDLNMQASHWMRIPICIRAKEVME